MSVRLIAIAGGPSTGKTTLARELANKLAVENGYNTFYVSEFAREYIAGVQGRDNKNKYVPQMSDQLLFIDEQEAREHEAPPDTDFIITDSPLFLTAVYSWRVHDDTFYRDTEQYLHIYRNLIKDGITSRYSDIFVLNRVFEDKINDGVRVQTPEESKEITEQVIGFLQFHGMKFTLLDDVHWDSIVNRAMNNILEK